jgi:hypothetical protein
VIDNNSDGDSDDDDGSQQLMQQHQPRQLSLGTRHYYYLSR